MPNDYEIDQLESFAPGTGEFGSDGFDFEFDDWNEFGDEDATRCALGDYNAFEEGQIYQDREWED